MAPESTVLDMGAGSGVLSIVAALLGARRVVGIDRAIGAVGVAQRNAERNGVSEVTEFFQGSTVPIGEQFDVVAANILAPVLLDLVWSHRQIGGAWRHNYVVWPSHRSKARRD